MKRSRWIAILLVLCGLGAAALWFRSSCPATHPVLRVGVLSAKTGVMAAHGASIEMGVQLAERVLNRQGGVLGRKVEVISLDTQSDPGVAVERARELLQRYRVNLLIGTGLSSE